MTYSVFLRTSVAVASFAILATNIPTQSHAEKYNICQLDTVPVNIQRRITRRADFEEILGEMFASCPDAALALTEAATASIGLGSSDDFERAGDSDSDPGDSGPSDNGGGNGGGGNGGGGNGGGGNGGGGEGGGGEGGGGEGGGGEGGGGEGGGGEGGGGEGGGGEGGGGEGGGGEGGGGEGERDI
ncbi:MAG: hypothetical protein ABJV68_26650 [Paracoccaceae bacterium]